MITDRDELEGDLRFLEGAVGGPGVVTVPEPVAGRDGGE